MYSYYEYFDIDKRNRPYTVPGEELEDHLRLLDMMLESYLEYKGMGNSNRLFSRGLVITESEMTSYFDMPPYYRERDICDPVLSAAVQEAFDYINSRTKATKESLRPEEKKSRKKKLPENDSSLTEKELLRIEFIKNTFDLNQAELIAVLMSLAVEIDRRYERIIGFLQDDISKRTPTIGLIHALMGRITPREGSEETIPVPLSERMYTYFFIHNDENENLTTLLQLHPMMKQFLMGVQNPRAIYSIAFRLYGEENNIPVFFEDSYGELDYILSQETKKGSEEDSYQKPGTGQIIYLSNEDDETVLHLLNCYCATHGEKLYILDLEKILNMKNDMKELSLSEAFLHLKLYGGRLAIRYLSENDADSERRQELKDVLSKISRAVSPKYISVYGQKEEPGELAAMYIPNLKIPEVSVMLRTKIWDHFLHTESDVEIDSDVIIPDLADCYEVSYGMIHKAVGHAFATAQMKRIHRINRKMLLESLRQMNQVDFSGLATYVNPSYTWEDITITDEQKAIMKTACDRYRLRNRIGEGWGLKRKNAYGNGISILLYGPPGTGKTMAAQVIANELALPLYRVDISQISSKYIGETEKNLAVIFNAALKANVILFFDEADALFAKRTSVGDSHDKYANSETAYLLQKIEEYDGMSILSTNYYNNFDDAFVRRITYSVRLDSPDETTRLALWTTILPKTAKIADGINFKFIADKFELSGSNIKAILFNAAYMAGAEGSQIEAKHIVRAMEYEFNKLGKLVHSSDFGEYEIYLRSYDPEKALQKKQEKPVRRKKL